MPKRLGGLVCAGLAAVVLLQVQCSEATRPAGDGNRAISELCRDSNLPPDKNAPQLDCAAPPNTFEVTGYFKPGAPKSVKAEAGPAFDAWAWASFAAFNWPAKKAAGEPTGYLRGVPDLDASFRGATHGDVLVWETFKEKREVFNDIVTADGWQALTFPPDQSINLDPAGEIPPCPGPEAPSAQKLAKGKHRRILQASKLAPALGVGPHALDETAEVASPAQESQRALCAGYLGHNLSVCQGLFSLPPHGNPDTTYPPNIPNPRPALGVGPRVYDPNGNLVFYEVRVNYDYFNYVLQNRLNFNNPTPTLKPVLPPKTIRTPPYQLPWRTSAQSHPATRQPIPLSLDTVLYDADSTVATYRKLPPSPPPIGSVQVKSAWRMLGPNDDKAQYHTTDAVYFMSRKGAASNVCYSTGTFLLIGLHIIQRVHMGDKTDGNADPVGGTFIFATWEHDSIANGGGYSYVNFLANKGADQENPTPYPTHENAIAVSRRHAYPLHSTRAVNDAVHKQLPARSVWRNYRLIGTQFYANVTSTTSQSYNQPYYLANLVVETNDGLQSFQGLPPNLPPVKYYYGSEKNPFKSTGKAYEPNFDNVSFNGTPYNMGGCMGCHGVAQILGSSFSFVLLDGQKGAGIDTLKDVSIPP